MSVGSCKFYMGSCQTGYWKLSAGSCKYNVGSCQTGSCQLSDRTVAAVIKGILMLDRNCYNLVNFILAQILCIITRIPFCLKAGAVIIFVIFCSLFSIYLFLYLCLHSACVKINITFISVHCFLILILIYFFVKTDCFDLDQNLLFWIK
jgi:hypothetical protein